MLHYFSMTPKPHYAHSNSATVGQLNMGPLAAWEKRKASEEYQIQSCEVYTDRQGRKRFKGTSHLRKTERLFCILYKYLECVGTTLVGMVSHPQQYITLEFYKNPAKIICIPESKDPLILYTKGVSSAIWIQDG